MNFISLTNDELDDISYALGEVVTDKLEYRNRHAPESEVQEIDEAISRLEALQTKVGTELSMRTRIAERAPDVTDLAVIVARQLRSDDLDELRGTMGDVCRGGAAGGFPGFTYHRETVPFTDQNSQLLMWLMADEMESVSTRGTPLSEFIAEFNCVDLSAREVEAALFSREGDDWTTVANAISWWALEKVASEMEDGRVDVQRLRGALQCPAPEHTREDDEDEHQTGVGR